MMLKAFLLLCIIENLALGFSSPYTIHKHRNRPILSTERQSDIFYHHSRSGTQVAAEINEESSSTSCQIVSQLRGGSTTTSNSDCPMKKLGNNLISIWACEGFVLMLVNSIRRLVPKALEPFKTSAEGFIPLTTFQLGAYIAMCLFFAYAEGYKGFQRKFAPMLVARSFTISPNKIHHILLGPFYSMGLFHATKKRKIVSWSLAFGIVAIVAGVKRLPYPWKNIVDAGVVVGLSWGAAAIQIGFLKALFTRQLPDADPCLP